jgi:hypothetical protein
MHLTISFFNSPPRQWFTLKVNEQPAKQHLELTPGQLRCKKQRSSPIAGDAIRKAAKTSWPGCGCLFYYLLNAIQNRITPKKQKATKTGHPSLTSMAPQPSWHSECKVFNDYIKRD